MKLQTKTIFVLFALQLTIQGCDDLIEKDLSNESVKVNVPQSNYISSNYQVQFWWESNKNARTYRVQIVSPSFDSLNNFILDTLVSGTKLTYTLFPGIYQWRIRAENPSSSSRYQVYNFKVDTTSDLTGQLFYTVSPASDLYTNELEILYEWHVFPYATNYEYNLLDSVNVVRKVRLTTSNFLRDTLVEGKYKWRVKAVNGNNQTSSQYSDLKTIVIDVTAPSPSLLNSPADNDSVTSIVKLKWDKNSDVYSDSLYLSTDSLFSNMVGTYETGLNYIDLSNLNPNTRYYWRIRSKDKAGNVSGYSPYRSFYVIP